MNPRRACTLNGFRDRPVRPLRHPSERGKGSARRAAPRWSGEGGIRTLEAGITPPNALAGRRLQPLGHFSSSRQDIDRKARRTKALEGGPIVAAAALSAATLAHEVVGKGAVETQKAVVTAEGVEQVADDLRDVVQMQTLVFSDWPPFAGHSPREGLRAAPDLLTARDVCGGECLRENVLTVPVESSDTKALIFALDDHGRIDHGQRVAAINWGNVYRFSTAHQDVRHSDTGRAAKG